MTNEEKLNEYLKIVKDDIQLILNAGDYIGNVTAEFNIKGNEINNVNIGGKRSLRIS